MLEALEWVILRYTGGVVRYTKELPGGFNVVSTSNCE
jgi:hypothetical protein